ncbi:MAG: MBG domain-containing protein, partial [Anaeroplasmataceae bacterium]
IDIVFVKDLKIGLNTIQVNQQLQYYTANYAVNTTNGVLEYLKAELTVSVFTEDIIYGNANPEFNVVVNGLVGDDKFSDLESLNGQNIYNSIVITSNYNANSSTNRNVGTYNLNVRGLSESHFYKLNYVTSTFNVVKATLSASISDKEITYGSVFPSDFNYQITGFLYNDTVSSLDGKHSFVSTYNPVAGSENRLVGTYPVSIVNLSSPNYNIVTSSGSVIVKPKELNINIIPYDLVYGNANVQVKFNVVGDPAAYLETNSIASSFIYSLNDFEGTDYSELAVGKYKILIEGNTSEFASNYIFNYEETSLNVIPRKIHISVANASINYGDDFVPNVIIEGALEADIAGLLELVKVQTDYSTIDPNNRNVGSYVISVDNDYIFDNTAEGPFSNYEINKVNNAVLVVNKAKISVTMNDIEREYGYKFDVKDVDYNISGFLYEDDIKLNILLDTVYDINYLETRKVGQYLIEGYSTIVLQNYDIDFNEAYLTITQRDLTVSVADKVINYGSNYGKFDLSISGYFSSDYQDIITNVTILTSYDLMTNNNSGIYDIQLEYTNENYNIVLNNAKLTVHKINLTVNLNDIVIVYGDVVEDDKYTYTASGFVNSDTIESTGLSFSFSTNYDPSINVPSNRFNIFATLENQLTNYNVIINNGFILANSFRIYFNVFDANVESGEEVVIINFGDELKLNQTPILSKTGYTFIGWYTDELFRNKYDFTSKVNSNFKLYARLDRNEQTIFGKVVNTSNEGVANAKVSILDNSYLLSETVTDEFGYFSLSNAINGVINFKITISSIDKDRSFIKAYHVLNYELDNVIIVLDDKNVNTDISVKSSKNSFIVSNVDSILTTKQLEEAANGKLYSASVEINGETDETYKSLSKRFMFENKDILAYFVLDAIVDSDQRNLKEDSQKFSGLLKIIVKLESKVSFNTISVLRNVGGEYDELSFTPNQDGEYIELLDNSNYLEINIVQEGEFVLLNNSKINTTQNIMSIVLIITSFAVCLVSIKVLATKKY